MEDTVSLKAYQILRREKKDLTEKAVEIVKVLEKVEEFLKVEEIETDLIEEISEVLDEWYR